MSIIFHIDVNSAYLSWTAAESIRQGNSLDIRNIVSIIGGDQKKRRGVVLARSESAKALGIKTGEPIATARQKYRDIYMIAPDHDLYRRSSNELLELLGEYTDELERYSIDEAFCDMSHYKNNYMDVAKEMSKRIEEELGFTVNIGIGDNKLLAKMASDFEKPNKIHTLYKSEIEEKLWPLDVGELFMVGKSTRDRLYRRGIRTIGDLAVQDRTYIYHWLKKHGLTIHDYANGISNDEVKSEKRNPKSIGHSTTISYDVEDFEDGKNYIHTLSYMVAARLKKHKKLAGVVSVSIKNKDFSVMSRQITLNTPTDDGHVIYSTSIELLSELWHSKGIRLFSVSTGDLISEETVQLSMFQDSEDVDIDIIDDHIVAEENKRLTFNRMEKMLNKNKAKKDLEVNWE